VVKLGSCFFPAIFTIREVLGSFLLAAISIVSDVAVTRRSNSSLTKHEILTYKQSLEPVPRYIRGLQQIRAVIIALIR
jgi:hypothetical protein